jgi:uncharacterized short protein YbdD (DUF466 family)
MPPRRADIRRTSRLERLRRAWRALARISRQVAGAPDYAAYLAHCRRAGHPPRCTERQFLDEFFAAKGSRSRCC